ncbi:MAG: hypothetical protein ABH879_05215 [archaeon]
MLGFGKTNDPEKKREIEAQLAKARAELDRVRDEFKRSERRRQLLNKIAQRDIPSERILVKLHDSDAKLTAAKTLITIAERRVKTLKHQKKKYR